MLLGDANTAKFRILDTSLGVSVENLMEGIITPLLRGGLDTMARSSTETEKMISQQHHDELDEEFVRALLMDGEKQRRYIAQIIGYAACSHTAT